MPQSPVRFLYDQAVHEAANARGENYWYAGIHEILDQMGLTADEIGGDGLVEGGLEGVRALILPNLPPGHLSRDQVQEISEWVSRGGLLVALGTEALDDTAGILDEGRLPQPGDAWTTAAAVRLTDEGLARSLYSPETMDAPVPILAPVRRVAAAGRELARLCTVDGDDLGAPAAMLLDVGEGRVCTFAFDLCQAIWALHQGRPIDQDYDGDGYYRFSDAMTFRPTLAGSVRRIDVPYADLLLLLLRNVLSLAGVWFVSPTPPTEDGQVADAVFYWGGDDEGLEDGSQCIASDWMREQGLPYHINIMPHPDGRFGLKREEFERIVANGHEPSLHFNFIEGREHPYSFTEAEIGQQVAWYEATFGTKPVCSVFHWCTWHGWSEPAEWMARCGMQADNSRIHSGSPPLNPSNMMGYSFGTAWPFWYRTDWRGGNRRVNFLSEQIVAYECGYVSGEGTDFTALQRAIRDAGHWHFTLDLFHHPVYIAHHEECREAIRETLRYAEELGLKVVRMGNDGLNHWWRARSETRVEGSDADVTVSCKWPAGCVIYRRAEEGTEELGGKWEYRVIA